MKRKVEYKRKGIKEPWVPSMYTHAEYLIREQIMDQLKGYKSNLVYRYAKKK